MLKICFLGKIKVEYMGQSITEVLGTKTIALIGLLMLNNKSGVSREKIVAYLWPDSSEDAAKYNLRFNLWLIKKNIGKDKKGNTFLCVDKERCGINERYQYDCDILQITDFKAKAKDEVEELLELRELFAGEFFEGGYISNCDEFNDLILFERINLEKKKVCILKRLSELYEERESYDACLDVVSEIQEIEPYDEEIAVKMMSIYALKGNTAKAIDYYNVFSNKLAVSLGIAPSEDLRRKCDELRAGLELNATKDKGSVREKGIEIILNGIKTIDFFGVSQMIEQILAQVGREALWDLEKIYINDLAYIQRKILMYGKREKSWEFESVVPSDSCIANGFIAFIKSVCKKHTITVRIDNSSEVDEPSRNIIQLLKKLKLITTV